MPTVIVTSNTTGSMNAVSVTSADPSTTVVVRDPHTHSLATGTLAAESPITFTGGQVEAPETLADRAALEAQETGQAETGN